MQSSSEDIIKCFIDEEGNQCSVNNINAVQVSQKGEL